MTNEEISQKVCDAFIRNRKDVIAKIDKNNSIIQDLNNRIEYLIIARNSILRDNYELTSTIVGSFHFLCCNYKDLQDAFNNEHFESKLVKDSVEQVRRIFFDDTKEIYQKYNCVDMDFENRYSGDNSIRFIFSNGEKEFQLALPISPYNRNTIQRTESTGGFIHIVYNLSECCINSSRGSLNIDDVRKEIIDFMNSPTPQDFEDIHGFKKDKNRITLGELSGKYLNEDIFYPTYSCKYDGNSFKQYQI